MSEILIIAAVALVFIGPERFPEFAKIVMRTVRDLRRYVDDMKDDVREELRPVSNEIKKLSRYDPETGTMEGPQPDQELRAVRHLKGRAAGVRSEGPIHRPGNVDYLLMPFLSRYSKAKLAARGRRRKKKR